MKIKIEDEKVFVNDNEIRNLISYNVDIDCTAHSWHNIITLKIIPDNLEIVKTTSLNIEKE